LGLVSSAPTSGILGDQPRRISPSLPEAQGEGQPALWPVDRLPRAGEPEPGYLVVETKQQEQIARWQIAFPRCFTRPPGTSARHPNLHDPVRRNSELSFQPVRPSAPTLDGVRHASGDIRRRKPVAVSRAQNSQTSIQPSLPFRTFVPPATVDTERHRHPETPASRFPRSAPIARVATAPPGRRHPARRLAGVVPLGCSPHRPARLALWKHPWRSTSGTISPLSRDRSARNDLSLTRNGCRLSATSIPGGVPSDLISSPLTTGMHGIELCDPERGALRLSAPLRTFSPFAGSMPPGTPPAASLSGPDCSQRPFAHPQRVPPLGDLHSGVNVPGLPLRNPSRLASVPVRPFGSATALRFAPLAAASIPQARCTSTVWFG